MINGKEERPAGSARTGAAGATAWLPAIFLLAAVIVVYLPALSGGFLWDDDSYVTGSRTIGTAEGFRAIWLEPGATTQYYPLVHTFFWVEEKLWGFRPFGYHLVNVLLHGLGALMLGFVLKRLALPGAWFAAALFALHPVHVESVAWITERKNVLSGLFYFSAMLAWLRWSAGAGRRWYAVALLLFIFALFSKTVTATLPAALLLLVWWKRGEVRRREFVSLLPFFLCGIALGAGTIWIERSVLGAQGVEWSLSPAGRLLLAGRALFFYAGKLAWPSNLTFIYPRWEINPSSVTAAVFPAAAIAIFGLLYGVRRKIGRGPLTAALFFAGTLVPALGFIDVYPFRYSFVADHFQYLASAGPLALFAAILYRRAPARLRLSLSLPVLLLLALLTWRQCGVYHDLETLWRDTIAKNDTCWMAHNNLGRLLASEMRTGEAIEQYEAALRIRPGYDKALNNLGLAFESEGRGDEAIARYREAIGSNPASASARSNLGLALLGTGRTEEAIEHLAAALKTRPRAPELHTNLAIALARAGRIAEAERGFREAVRLAPNDPENRHRLELFLKQTGRAAEGGSPFSKTPR